VESYQKELTEIRTILKDHPKGMTVTDIAKELRINRNSVAKYLDVLLISGHVEMVTFGPAKVFFPSRRVPLSALLNFTLEYIAVLDRNLMFIQVSDNFLKFFHLEREGIIGQQITNISQDIFHIPELLPNTQQALDGKETTVEVSYLTDEHKRFLRMKHIPTTFEDGEPGVTLLMEDITDRKYTEEKMKQAIQQWETTFNSITDMISIQDPSYSIVRANRAFARFVHRTPEECIGKKCHELLHGMSQFHPSCPCVKVQMTKQPSTVEFYEPYLGKYLEISASPIFTETGELTGSVHIMKDITERKKKEQ